MSLRYVKGKRLVYLYWLFITGTLCWALLWFLSIVLLYRYYSNCGIYIQEYLRVWKIRNNQGKLANKMESLERVRELNFPRFKNTKLKTKNLIKIFFSNFKIWPDTWKSQGKVIEKPWETSVDILILCKTKKKISSHAQDQIQRWEILNSLINH